MLSILHPFAVFYIKLSNDLTIHAVLRIFEYMRNPIEAFKAIGDQTRFRALRLLAEANTELCACELIDAMEKPQYAISKALGVLVDAELLDERRDGRMMFYALKRNAMNDALFEAVARVPETAELKADAKRLKARLSRRVNNYCTSC